MSTKFPKRVWLITYGASSPTITHAICSECGIEIDECYSLTQRDFKYTLIHSNKRKTFLSVKQMLNAAEIAHGIKTSNIFGYDVITGNTSRLKDHPGMKLMIDHMNRKDINFQHWLSKGNLYSNARGVMHRFLVGTDVSSHKLTRTQLEFLLGEKCKQFDEEREELRARLIECEQLNEALGEQNDELRAKYKRARTEISKLRATLSIYEEDSGMQNHFFSLNIIY